jgi:peptidoglycan/LPS O-acetylase OafA/YrhL
MTAQNASMGATGRIAAIDGLRALAALFVFWVHLSVFVHPVAGIGNAWSQFLLDHRSVGSRTFLLISGCMIYRSLLKSEKPIVEFWRRRLVRLYPVYLTVLAAYLLASALIPSMSKIPSDPGQALVSLAENIFLIQGITHQTSIITQAWTLGFLLVAYFLIPFAARGLRYLRLDAMCRLCMLAIVAFSFEAAFGVWSPWTALVLGMCAAELITLFPKTSWRTSGALTIVGFAAWAVGEIPYSLVCLLLLVMENGSVLSKILTWRPLEWVGKRSYALYVSHGLVIHGVSLLFGRAAFGTLQGEAYWLMQAFVLTGALSLSALLHSFVDEPVGRWLNASKPAFAAATVRPRPILDLAARDHALAQSGR